MKRTCTWAAALLVAVGSLLACSVTVPEVKEASTLRSKLNESLARMPVVLDGIAYSCAKLKLTRAKRERNLTFLKITEDAEALRGLAAIVPRAAKLPGKQGRLLLKDELKLIALADRIIAAGKAKDVKKVTQAFGEARKACLDLIRYINRVKPYLARV